MTDLARWARQNLGYEFSDPGLLERALTHRSASRHNNERLEFLGDAMLGLAVARDLYESRPDGDEGDLSRARASLVNKQALATVGRRLNLENHIVLGTGERRSCGAQRASALADAVEAVIGAVVLDGGHEADASMDERRRIGREFPARYRQICHHLSLARALAPDHAGDPAAMARLLGFSDADTALAVVARWREVTMNSPSRRPPSGFAPSSSATMPGSAASATRRTRRHGCSPTLRSSRRPGTALRPITDVATRPTWSRRPRSLARRRTR